MFLDPSRSCVLHGISSCGLKRVVFSHVWGLMAPMDQNLSKTRNFEVKSLFCLARRGCAAPAANFYPGPLQTMRSTRFKLLGLQKRRVFPCLGPDGSNGQKHCKTIYFGTISLFYLLPTMLRPRRQLPSWAPPDHMFYEVSAPGASNASCFPMSGA